MIKKHFFLRQVLFFKEPTQRRGDKKEEVSQRWKLPTFDGTSKWGPYAKQSGVIFEMNNCTDPKWRAFKIIEGLRGKAMEYFDTLSKIKKLIIGRQPGMAVRMPTPINQLLMMNPLQYKLYFWMIIRGISHGFNGTQD